MNMQKIAELAGCSLSTVSKAFKGSKEISPETREKIFNIAKEKNCFNKYYSPKLEKKVFAVICPEITSLFYTGIVEAIQKKVSENGDILLISSNNFTSSTQENFFDYFINFNKIDGLIFFKESDNKIIKNIPAVYLGSKTQKIINYDHVDISFISGIYKVAEYLKNNGHTKIGFIGEYYTAISLNIFKEALMHFGLPLDESLMITSKKRKAEAGYDGMEKILASNNLPTAVFTAYDSIAIGAMNRIAEAGLKVPDDISIIGKDNIPLSAYTNPPLTTISLPTDEIAECAMNLLYRRIKNRNTPYRHITIDNSLIVRDSVKNLS